MAFAGFHILQRIGLTIMVDWAKGWHRRYLLVICTSCGLLCASYASADLKTHQIKAAYLYQIAKFVFWPDERKRVDNFQVCQLGQDSYQGTLNKMTGRTVFSRPVLVRTVTNLDSAEGCHLLVLSDPSQVNLADLRLWLGQNKVLTVVDGEQNHPIGMVAFVLENQRVRLHINVDLAKQANLSFAANLLEVASHIYHD